MHLAENLVTTMSPSAIWYSKVTSAKERAAWNSVATACSPPDLSPGQQAAVCKGGGQQLLDRVQIPVDESLKEAAAKALFFSCSEDKAASSLYQPAFLQRVDTIHDATRRGSAH